MAWSYSDWITKASDSERLTALREHIAEVSADISARLATGGETFDPTVLRDYLEHLRGERQELEKKVDAQVAATATGFVQLRPKR